MWFSGLANLDPTPSSDEMMAACTALTVDPVEMFTRPGQAWAAGRYTETLYNHVAVPNSSAPDCSANRPFDEPRFDIATGQISARSWHPGGIHALTMDGSARFVKQTIQAGVWRSLGTRAGGEPINSGDL
jgi:hypothetical protein